MGEGPTPFDVEPLRVSGRESGMRSGSVLSCFSCRTRWKRRVGNHQRRRKKATRKDEASEHPGRGEGPGAIVCAVCGVKVHATISCVRF